MSAPILTACPCKYTAPAGVSPTSSEFHRQHRAHHLRAFPDVDHNTHVSLNQLVATFERKEAYEAELAARPKHAIPVVDATNGAARSVIHEGLRRVNLIVDLAFKEAGDCPLEALTSLVGATATLIARIAVNPEAEKQLFAIAMNSLDMARRMAPLGPTAPNTKPENFS